MLQLLQLPRAQVFSTADTAASCSGVEHAQLLSSDSRLWDLAVTEHPRAAFQRICKALGASAGEQGLGPYQAQAPTQQVQAGAHKKAVSCRLSGQFPQGVKHPCNGNNKQQSSRAFRV